MWIISSGLALSLSMIFLYTASSLFMLRKSVVVENVLCRYLPILHASIFSSMNFLSAWLIIMSLCFFASLSSTGCTSPYTVILAFCSSTMSCHFFFSPRCCCQNPISLHLGSFPCSLAYSLVTVSNALSNDTLFSFAYSSGIAFLHIISSKLLSVSVPSMSKDMYMKRH